MTTGKMAKSIDEQLRAVATANRRQGMERYFTTDMERMGVTAPDLRMVVKKTATLLRTEKSAMSSKKA